MKNEKMENKCTYYGAGIDGDCLRNRQNEKRSRAGSSEECVGISLKRVVRKYDKSNRLE